MENLKVVEFAKYHGCGNSFIILSNLNGEYDYIAKNSELIKQICDPNFGIGSDGILCIKAHDEYDFAMEYYNAKYGKLSGFCGNGSRCSIQFALDTGIIDRKLGTFFVAGKPCDFSIEHNLITVKLIDLNTSCVTKISEDEMFVDLGSPHHMKFVANVENFNVYAEGRKIRHSEKYNKPDHNGLTGVNVSFVQDLLDSKFRIRTYERTVEGETQACGSGSVASAIAASVKSRTDANVASTHYKQTMVTNGGTLVVEFDFDGSTFSKVKFTGPATKVCTGVYHP